MSPVWRAVRSGFARGRIEVRQQLTDPGDLTGIVIFSALGFVALVAMRHVTAPGTDFSLGTMMVPSLVGMNVVFLGMVGVAALLTMDREDGTLLRAKVVPNGMEGYLTAKVFYAAVSALLGLAIPLGYGVIFFRGLAVGGAGSWLTLAPWALRQMAHRQSGSRVAAARDRHLRRVG